MAFYRAAIGGGGSSNITHGTAPDHSENTNYEFTVDTGLSSISEFVMVGWALSNHNMRKYCYYNSSIPGVYDSVTADSQVGLSIGANAAGLTIVSINGGVVTIKTGQTYRRLYDATWFAKA